MRARAALAMAREARAQGRARSARANHLRTDSRVLRRARAVDASVKASAAKFFPRGESGRVGGVAAAKARAIGFRAGHDRARVAQRRVTKNPHFTGTSAALPKSRAGARRAEIFSPRILRPLAPRARRTSAARELHTKLSGYTVIFFLL